MKNNNSYFVYSHIRTDNNQPFYIGIGTIRKGKNGHVGKYFRAYCKQKRNNLWTKIANKTKYDIKILLETEDRNVAINEEKRLIGVYGRMITGTGVLSNITEGGEGATGFKRSEKDRLNKSIAHISMEERYIIRDLYIIGISTKTIAKDRNHCKKSVCKILKDYELLNNRYTVLREDGLKFKTEKEACKFMNCARGYISMAINKQKKCLGYNWFKINQFDNVDEKEIERLKKTRL